MIVVVSADTYRAYQRLRLFSLLYCGEDVYTRLLVVRWCFNMRETHPYLVSSSAAY